nr:hypothetical protein [Tanacetum cinerariifolium]
KFVLNNEGKATGQMENFVSTAVITNSCKVPVNTDKQSSPRAAASTSTARYVNTAGTRPTVNGAKPSSNVFHKSHSLVRRTLNQRTAPKNSVLKEKINTAMVNNVTTAGTKAVVSVVQGNKENTVKSLACWIWRPTGNAIDHIFKDSGSYMLKRFNYVDHTVKSTSPSLLIIKILMEDLLHLEEVLKETECLVLSLDFKLPDENQVLLKFPRQHNMYRFDLKNAIPSGGGQEKESNHEYILLPFMPLSIQSSHDKDADDVPVKGDEGVSKGSSIDDQEKTNSSTQDVDTVEPSINTASININTGSLNINIVGSNDPNMTSLEETSIFDYLYDDTEVGAETDTNNLELSTVISHILTIRVHKDHPKEQIIGDLNLTTQTRIMLNFSKENVMMDVKSAFLYGIIEEEVYVCQPPGFEDLYFPNKKSLCNEFEQTMHKRFQMSSMGELTFFLGLQVKQKDDGIFISQNKSVVDILKKFDFTTVKENQEKDKIGTKPNKNEKRGEAERSQKQLQWRGQEKLKKMQKERP